MAKTVLYQTDLLGAEGRMGDCWVGQNDVNDMLIMKIIQINLFRWNTAMDTHNKSFSEVLFFNKMFARCQLEEWDFL